MPTLSAASASSRGQIAALPLSSAMRAASIPRSPIASLARWSKAPNWHRKSCGIEERAQMKLSTERILTTHVGSLPRPQPLVAMLIKKDRDEPYDRAEFEAQVKQAVADVVARQVAIGIDVVSDGEASKVGYATYVHERLTGFSGEPFVPKPNLDVAPYDDFRRRLELFIGPQQIRRLCCQGPVARQDHASAQRDIDNF